MAIDWCRGAHTVNTVPSGTTRAPRSRSSTRSGARSVFAMAPRLVWGVRLEALQAAQHFSDAPCLRHAATRHERRAPVEDLADRPDARVIEMAGESLQQQQRIVFAPGVHAQPGVDVWANQPRPHGPLVIGGIARAQI